MFIPHDLEEFKDPEIDAEDQVYDHCDEGTNVPSVPVILIQFLVVEKCTV